MGGLETTPRNKTIKDTTTNLTQLIKNFHQAKFRPPLILLDKEIKTDIAKLLNLKPTPLA